MKKFLLLLTSVCLFMVSCQTDTTTDNTIGIGNGEEGTTLAVSLAETRTTLGGKVGTSYPVYWSEGDQLVVNGYLSDEVQIDEDNRASALFTFKKAELNHPYYITYPYCASTTDSQPVVEFQSEQTYAEGTFAAGYAPMCGYTKNRGDKIVLSHLAATLRIPIKTSYDGVVLEKVVITSSNKIAGEFAVDCENATISATEGCSNIVTYTLPANFALSTSTARDLFITLPAIHIGTCTIEFVEASGKKMVANWAPNAPLSKGIVREFKPITYKEQASVSLEMLPVEEDEFTIYYKNLSGYVRYSDGSPIANVAVSDGFQVVTTDENGYYELSGVTRDAWYIFCSLPSDVKVPIDEYGRPCYFQKYEANKREYNFAFKKLQGGVEKEFALLLLADTQVGASASIERFKAQASPEIKNYSQSVGIPCYGITLGDVVYSPSTKNNEHLFNEMRDALSAEVTGIPIFSCFGNHDNCYFSTIKPAFPDERSSTFNLKIQRVFEECFGPINYSFNRGDVHIVSMRNMLWKTNVSAAGDNTSTAFSEEQYNWLEQDLACVSKDKTVILCVHIPIFNKGKTYESCKFLDETLTLLDQFDEQYVMSGHLHFRECYDHVKKGTGHKVFEQSWSSAHGTGYGDNANLNCDGAPSGYGVIKFENGKMAKSIHKGYPYGMNSEDYQIRLHRGGDITGAAIPEGDANKNGTKGYYQFPYDSNTILANIFSSDPWWTVEVWLYTKSNGNRIYKIGTMSSLNSYNNKPTWEELIGSFTYDDPKRAPADTESGRDYWTTGVVCGHLGNTHSNRFHECHTMWKYQLSSTYADSDIMVVAKDRWGNEYTQTEFQVGTDMGYAVYDEQYNPK